MRKQRVLFVLLAHRATYIYLLIIINIYIYLYCYQQLCCWIILQIQLRSVSLCIIWELAATAVPCICFIWASLTLLARLYSFVYARLLHVHWCDPNPHTALVPILSYFVTVGWVIDFSLFIHMYMRNSFWMRLVLLAVTRSGEKAISSWSFLQQGIKLLPHAFKNPALIRRHFFLLFGI